MIFVLTEIGQTDKTNCLTPWTCVQTYYDNDAHSLHTSRLNLLEKRSRVILHTMTFGVQ